MYFAAANRLQASVFPTCREWEGALLGRPSKPKAVPAMKERNGGGGGEAGRMSKEQVGTCQ